MKEIAEVGKKVHYRYYVSAFLSSFECLVFVKVWGLRVGACVVCVSMDRVACRCGLHWSAMVCEFANGSLCYVSKGRSRFASKPFFHPTRSSYCCMPRVHLSRFPVARSFPSVGASFLGSSDCQFRTVYDVLDRNVVLTSICLFVYAD